MVLAGAGVGLSAGPLAMQARFSLPNNRVAVVSSMTLFVSCVHALRTYISTDSTPNSPDRWAEQSASHNAAPY